MCISAALSRCRHPSCPRDEATKLALRYGFVCPQGDAVMVAVSDHPTGPPVAATFGVAIPSTPLEVCVDSGRGIGGVGRRGMRLMSDGGGMGSMALSMASPWSTPITHRCFAAHTVMSEDMSSILLSAPPLSHSTWSYPPPPPSAPAVGPYDLIRVQQKQPVHLGIMCDGCNFQNFSGLRFKCEQCPDFDLCSSCYHERNEHAETGHSFMVIPAPGEAPRTAQARGSRSRSHSPPASRSPPALPAPPPALSAPPLPQQQELQHAARIAMQQKQQQAVASAHNVSMQAYSKHSDHSPPPSADLGDVSVLVVLGAMRSGSWSLGHGVVNAFLTKHLPSAIAMCQSDAHSTLAVIVVLRAHFKPTKQGWHLHVIRGKQYARAQLGDLEYCAFKTSLQKVLHSS